MPKTRSLAFRIFRAMAYMFGSIVAALFAYYYFATDDIRSLTSHLPPVDRIEVEFVHVKGETIDRVIATKTLIDIDAQMLRQIWRDQSYAYGISIMCHAPAYRIRFYQQGKMLTEATVCFHCHNIYFYKYPGAKAPDQVLEAVFGNMSEENQGYLKLRDYLGGLFPGHVSSESSERPK